MVEPINDYLPHHIYMSLWTDKKRLDIADIFAASGWSSRRCSWTDFEVEIENKAELVIESENPILVHGPIHSVTEIVPLICSILDEAGIIFTFEAFNEHDEIVAEFVDGDPKRNDGDHT